MTKRSAQTSWLDLPLIDSLIDSLHLSYHGSYRAMGQAHGQSTKQPTQVEAPLPETITKPAIDLEFVVVSDDELERPYRVIIENDDVTPMEFVELVLEQIFELDRTRATAVMLEAHYQNRALVGIYPYEDARDRVYAAHSIAREVGYPLSFYLEPDA
jgi:ATP-dependent Clp protease adaptor protein ClpS